MLSCFRVFILLSLPVLTQAQNHFYRTVKDSVFSSNVPASKNIFLLGEFHFRKTNVPVHFSFLRELNKNGIFPDYILLEQGYAFGYIINRYVSDTSYYLRNPLIILKRELVPFNFLRNSAEGFNGGKKYKFIGVDFERDISYTIEALNMLFERADTNLIHSSDTVALEVKSLIYELRNYWYVYASNQKMYGTVSKLATLYSRNQACFETFLKEQFPDFKLILGSFYQFERCAGTNFEKRDGALFMGRETYMANTIYALFQEKPGAIVFGQFGLAHVNLIKSEQYMKINFTSFCELLNTHDTYRKTNGKIFSGAIVYRNIKAKHYPFIPKKDFTFLKQKTKGKDMFILPDSFTPFFNCFVIPAAFK